MTVVPAPNSTRGKAHGWQQMRRGGLAYLECPNLGSVGADLNQDGTCRVWLFRAGMWTAMQLGPENEAQAIVTAPTKFEAERALIAQLEGE
jgi:hypothetical protein